MAVTDVAADRFVPVASLEELRAAALVPVKSILLLSSVFGLIGIGIAYRSRLHRRVRRAAAEAGSGRGPDVRRRRGSCRHHDIILMS